MSLLIPGLTGGIYGKKNKYVAVFRFCDILIIFLGTLSMSFRMCGLALLVEFFLLQDFSRTSLCSTEQLKYGCTISINTAMSLVLYS